MYLVKEWGYVDEYVVLALWKAHGCSGPRVCTDVEEIVRMAYKTLVGETPSFETAYGGERPDFALLERLGPTFPKSSWSKKIYTRTQNVC